MSQSELLIVESEMQKSTQLKKPRITNAPEMIKTEVETYALIHETKAALKCFNNIYPKYAFLRTPINYWKYKINKDKESGEVNIVERKWRIVTIDGRSG